MPNYPNLASGLAQPLDLARNNVVINVPAHDVNLADRTGLVYYIELYRKLENDDSYELVETLEAREKPKRVEGGVDVYDGAFFEISELLMSFLNSKRPQYEQSTIIPIPELTLEYYTKAIVKNNDLQVSSVTNPSRVAIAAGVSEQDWPQWQSKFFTEYIGESRKFLSYKGTSASLSAPFGSAQGDSVEQAISEGQAEMLYWLHNYTDDISTLNLVVAATPSSYVVKTATVLSLTDIEPMLVYSIPVGLHILRQSHSEGINILKYEVWLEDQVGNRVSEVRTYLPTSKYRHNVRHMYFRNSLGVFDLLTLYGEGMESIELESVDTAQFTGYDYSASVAETVLKDKIGTRMLEVTLQHSSKQILKYLTDLALSREYYLINEKGLIPLLLKDGYKPVDDSEDWGSRTFTFYYTNEERSYSELPEPVSEPERPTGWRKLASVCELDSRGRRTGRLRVTMLELIYTDTNEVVFPRRIKKNTANEDGYIAPVDWAGCALNTTPFLNAEYSEFGTFYKEDCDNGGVGGVALITIGAGSWGSTISQADADAKAEAEWKLLNTQAYANANGSCDAIGNYVVAGGVPVGEFWIRFASWDRSKTGNTGIAMNSAFNSYRPGNMWFNQDQADPTGVQPNGTWDVGFPTQGQSWKFYLYLQNNGGVERTLKFFRDGILIGESVHSDWHQEIDFPAIPNSGEKWFVDVR